MDNQVRRTTDRVAIGALLETYADVINRRAFDELDELFLSDCEIVIDTRRGDPIVVTSGAGLGAFVGAAIDRFDFFEFVILSKRLWVDGGDEADGRLFMCELRHDRATDKSSQAFGVYHDRFRRVDDRWWFASRRYHSLARTTAGGGRSLDIFEFPSIPSPETIWPFLTDPDKQIGWMGRSRSLIGRWRQGRHRDWPRR